MTKVVNPWRLKNYGDVESGIALWEEKVELLHSQFKEPLTSRLKSAVLLNTMPTGLQDQVLQHMKADANYDEIRDLIKRFAARKLESNGPTPMDIGNLQAPSWGSEEQGANWQEDQWAQNSGASGRKMYLGKRTTPFHTMTSTAFRAQFVIAAIKKVTLPQIVPTKEKATVRMTKA